MTKERAREHESTAKAHREEGDFEQAGEYFTVAAYEQFGHQPPLKYDHLYGQLISDGMYDLLHAAVCYRLAGKPDRSQNRCERGILIAEDMRDRMQELPVPSNEYDQARRGVWDEFIGDFRIVAGQKSAERAYDEARSIYEVADEFELSFAEREHLNLIQFYEDLALATGRDLDDWYDRKSKITFPEWIGFKRDQLPRLYESLIQSGTWG